MMIGDSTAQTPMQMGGFNDANIRTIDEIIRNLSEVVRCLSELKRVTSDTTKLLNQYTPETITEKDGRQWEVLARPAGSGGGCLLAIYRNGTGISMTPGTVGGVYPTIGGVSILSGPPWPMLSDPGPSSKLRFKSTVKKEDDVYKLMSVVLEVGDGEAADTAIVINSATGQSSSDGIYYDPAGFIDSSGKVHPNWCGSISAIFCPPSTLTLGGPAA